MRPVYDHTEVINERGECMVVGGALMYWLEERVEINNETK
jgi:hypothetical protein